jgi:hypothetical protein
MYFIGEGLCICFYSRQPVWEFNLFLFCFRYRYVHIFLLGPTLTVSRPKGLFQFRFIPNFPPLNTRPKIKKGWLTLYSFSFQCQDAGRYLGIFFRVKCFLWGGKYGFAYTGWLKVSVHLMITIQLSGAQRLYDRPLLLINVLLQTADKDLRIHHKWR